MTEPVLTIEIEGEEFLFMVDTGAMVSLIQPRISKVQVQPCDVKARGITGTQLKVLGEQEITFNIKGRDYCKTFVHTFVVSPMNRCSSGILGMDFLQRVGAEISLTTQSLTVGRYSFPLMDRGRGFSTVRRLINAGSEESFSLVPEEIEHESVGDWEGTVELAETVTVPPLSVRIARRRVVRRDASTIVKVPRNQEVLVDPEGLPGVLMARIIASLSNVGGSPPFKINKIKSSLVQSVFSPYNVVVAGNDRNKSVPEQDSGPLNVGAGECLPELPEDGLPVATISHRNDLQAESSSLPVEDCIGIQVDTQHTLMAQRNKAEKEGQESEIIESEMKRNSVNCLPKKEIQIMGYVPIHITNLSLEEIELEKHRYIGVASPIQLDDAHSYRENIVSSVERTYKDVKSEFKNYL